MNTLNSLQQGLGKAWHSISEGWQHFYQRCRGALTYFDSQDDPNENKDERRLSWGLLSTDLAEKDHCFVVSMEVPGLKKSDIDIHVDGDLLTISGTKRFEEERHEGEHHIMECAYGRFHRSFRLPAKVDEASVEASYKKGVLRLKLPKLAQAKKIQIEIK